MRWERQPGHYEVWYATVACPEARTGFWIRYTLESPRPGHGAPYAQLWFARFDQANPERTFGVNHRLPIDSLSASDNPFSLRIGDSELREDGMRGLLDLANRDPGPRRIEWDLKWRPSSRMHLHLPSFAYRARFPETFVLSPNLDVLASGHITIDGERLDLVDAPLGQTHLWGKKHAYSWAWSHCSSFDGAPGTTLETLTVRIRRGSIVLPPLTMITLYTDRHGPARFVSREPWHLPFSRSHYQTGRYHLEARAGGRTIDVELTCRPEDMVLAEYVDPDGTPAFCHNTCVADCRVTLTEPGLHGRDRDKLVLTSHGGAHWEWGARAADGRITHRHVTL